ncbi:putative toxin-antitoxin system toxin component, PIN family [Dyadobacter sandarakinus]|uniref:Toxin-antitoxin system toxin component, PIN family n=1 Tax=Dyadobacter sandarakinus TaxID=2747268 RepID=A0ABX7I7Y9_9BACT|nr:putative toxin-antitoxin system toxin component, PIN family [Dyadobacter sandarakinus]QRR01843.1 putative toxin-antitoxin system toxin component, PIN family [Dyadobacter sandarakinus]
MIRVVVDTNCLRASIPPKSPFYQLYLGFIGGKFQWYVSNEILFEYEEILSATYSSKTAHLVLHQLAIAGNVVFAEPAFRWNLITGDPDDNKFADLAISCGCDYLISNDKDFDIFGLLDFPKLKVLKLEEFIALLSQISS